MLVGDILSQKKISKVSLNLKAGKSPKMFLLLQNLRGQMEEDSSKLLLKRRHLAKHCLASLSTASSCSSCPSVSTLALSSCLRTLISSPPCPPSPPPSSPSSRSTLSSSSMSSRRLKKRAEPTSKKRPRRKNDPFVRIHEENIRF